MLDASILKILPPSRQGISILDFRGQRTYRVAYLVPCPGNRRPSYLIQGPEGRKPQGNQKERSLPRMPKTAVTGKRINRFQTDVIITSKYASRNAGIQALTGPVGQRDLPLFRIPSEATKFQPDSFYQGPPDGRRDVWLDYTGLYGKHS